MTFDSTRFATAPFSFAVLFVAWRVFENFHLDSSLLFGRQLAAIVATYEADRVALHVTYACTPPGSRCSLGGGDCFTLHRLAVVTFCTYDCGPRSICAS